MFSLRTFVLFVALLSPAVGLGQPLKALNHKVAALVTAYDPRSPEKTADGFSDLYFDVFEGPLENSVSAKDSALSSRIEADFARLSLPHTTRSSLLKASHRLQEDLKRASWLSSSSVSPVAQSFMILFREGMEALLIVAGLLSYVAKAGVARQARSVYGGVGAALIASALTAYITHTSLLGLSGVALEISEGLLMLVASVVLLYVSGWMLLTGKRWRAYLDHRVERAVSENKEFALGFLAFLAVYREGAETILFYQALFSEHAASSDLMLGMGLAVVALGAIFLTVRGLSLRLPMNLFFSVTAFFLFVFAFIFAGKGIVELQMGRLIPTTFLAYGPHYPWLGLFPTVQTVLAQSLILLLGCVYMMRRLFKWLSPLPRS